jgi:hypothetical protein
MNYSSPTLVRSTDPQPGIIFIMRTINIARPQTERVQGSRRITVTEQAAHEVRKGLWYLTVVIPADTEIDAGHGCPEVAPPPRQHAGPHHLPRLEEGHDVVQQRVRERTEAVGVRVASLAPT